MNVTITRLTAEREAAADFIATTLDAVEAETRDLSDTEVRAVETQKARITELDAQLKPLVEFEQTRAAAVRVDAALGNNPAGHVPRVTTEEVRTVGGLFTASEAFTEYRGGRGAIFTADIRPTEIRAILDTVNNPGKGLLPPPQKIYGRQGAIVSPLLETIARMQVDSGVAEVVISGEPTGAAVVAEGALKPEATLSLTVTQVVLETIAATAFATRQLIRSASAAQDWIDTQLTRAVVKKLEAQVAATVTGGTYALIPTGPAAGVLGQVRTAIGMVEGYGFTPDLLLAPPSALASIDTGLVGITGNPAIGGGYWGLRPVAVPGLDAMFVADASAAWLLLEQTGIDMYVTDSDIIGEGASAQSAFRRNVLSFIAEVRAKAVVANPQAAVEIALPTGSPVPGDKK